MQLGERAAPLADGGADGVDNHCVAHGVLLGDMGQGGTGQSPRSLAMIVFMTSLVPA